MSMSYFRGSLRYFLMVLLLIFSFLLPASILASAGTWQGPYLGGYFGPSFGKGDISTNVGSVTGTSYFLTNDDINVVNNAGNSTRSPVSVVAGITGGHDWAWKQMVYGLVFDFGVPAINSAKNVNNMSYADTGDVYSIHMGFATNWLMTLRGRLGYQANFRWPTLFYGTGGMAITQFQVNNYFIDNSSLAGLGGNSTVVNQLGWSAGMGIEFSPVGHLFLNFEYLYVAVPSVAMTSIISNSQPGFGIPQNSLNSPFTTAVDFHMNLLEMGLNYRFYE